MTTSRTAVRLAFLAIFFASGFAALLYQTIWQRILTLFGGADVSSVTVVVAAFMAGLGFGHLAGGYLADRLPPRPRIAAFAACELAVAIFAVFSASIYYDILYVRFGAVDLPYVVLAIVVFLVTLWPTFFMGMSLPLAARALTDGDPKTARWVPLLYGWNTLGAACGSFATVAVLFRSTDLTSTLQLGAALSLACGVAALILAPVLLRRVSPGSLPENASIAGGEPAAAAGSVVTAPPVGFTFATWVAVYALSGFVALSLEIVWFRVLGVILKSNAFTFGHLLTVYLGGVGLGALAGNLRWFRPGRPGPAFFLVQAAIPVYAALAVAAVVWSVDRIEWARPLWAYMASYEPITRNDLGIWGATTAGMASGLTVFVAAYLVLPLVLIGPPTAMMGLSFGLLQRAVQTDVRVLGRRVGWLQTANVAGATLGAVLTGLLLLDWFGSVGTLRILACTSAVYLWLFMRSSPAASRWGVALAAAVVVATPAALPESSVFWARLHGATPAGILQREDGSGLSLLKGVGSLRTVVYANGLGQSVLPYGGAHTALGALPTLLHASPRAVAVIGLGSGDTVFAAGGRRETTTIDTIEIIEGQLDTLQRLTRHMPYPALQMLLSDPRVRFHFTDGRAFIRKGGRRYDIIEADAVRATSAFAGNLYSVEYFEMLRDHLEPGGLAVSWLPTPRVRDSMLRVFPYLTTFADVGIGSVAPIDASISRIRERMREPFTASYFARGGVDLDQVLDRYLAAAPVLTGPELDRGQIDDVNRDLYPKDEFALPQVSRPPGSVSKPTPARP